MTADFDRALDAALERCTVGDVAGFGPIKGELRFASEAERAEWMSALIAPTGAEPAGFTAAFVTDPHAFDWLLPNGRETSLFFDDERYSAYWQCAPINLLHLYDRGTRRGLTWTPTGRAPERIYSRPLLPILHAATLDTPWLPLHAAAIGRNGHFLALAGGPGVGKTTAAIACAAAGWQYAGDDFVLVNSDSLEVAPLYASARTRTTAPADLGALITETTVARTDTEGDIRHELRFEGHEIGSRVAGGQIAAWLFPRRVGATSPQFQPARPRDGFGALMPVTTLHFPFGRGPMNARILRALGHAPLYFVDTGTNPSAISPAFDRFIEELAA